VQNQIQNIIKIGNTASGWLMLLVFCAFVMYWQTWVFSILYWWGSSTYGHGILILPLSAYLVWSKRSELVSDQNSPSIPGLIILFCFCIGWWLGYAVDVEIVSQLALIGILVGIFWVVKGWKITVAFLVPLLLPILALPLWSPIVPFLQTLTTQVVSTALQWINVPVYVESHYIQIPEGKISIEEVCAGLRYLLAAITVALVYDYLYISKLKNKIIFIAIVIVLSLAVNWIRVFTVILAGHLTNMTHTLVRDHADFGWWLFAFTLIPIFWLGGLLVKKEQKIKSHSGVQIDNSPDDSKSSKSSQNDSGIAIQSDNAGIQSERSANSIFIITFILILVVPLSGFYMKAQAKEASVNIKNRLAAPQAKGAWIGPSPVPIDMQEINLNPTYKGADEELSLVYKKESAKIVLYLAKYHYQEQNKELIADANSPFDTSSWLLMSRTARELKLPNGKVLNFVESVVRNNTGKTNIIWYWYSIAGLSINNSAFGKLMQLKDIISIHKNGSSVVVLALEANHGIDVARKSMKDYVVAMHDSIDEVIKITN